LIDKNLKPVGNEEVTCTKLPCEELTTSVAAIKEIEAEVN